MGSGLRLTTPLQKVPLKAPRGAGTQRKLWATIPFRNWQHTYLPITYSPEPLQQSCVAVSNPGFSCQCCTMSSAHEEPLVVCLSSDVNISLRLGPPVAKGQLRKYFTNDGVASGLLAPIVPITWPDELVRCR